MIHEAIQAAIHLAQNPTFSGIVAATLVGGLGWALKEVPLKIGNAILSVISQELSVSNDNVSYEWLETWLAEHPYSQSVLVRSLRGLVRPSETIDNDDYERVIAPGFGVHLMFHKGRPVLVDRWQDSDHPANMLTNKRVEGIRFRMFFASRKRLISIFDDAQERSRFIPGRIPVFLWTGGWWNKAPALRPRTLATVYLPNQLVEDVAKDVKTFTTSIDWYHSVGVPYRRGYLFKGYPGTGKTTLAIALASNLRRPVYVLPLAGIDNDTELAVAMMSVPRNALLLLEDIDTVDVSAQRADEKPKDEAQGSGTTKKGITLGGLLNGIDGVFASEGRILVMTTNHPEKLDDALIRDGRVDYTVDFPLADSEVMARMFNAFYEGTDEYKPEHFDEIDYMPAAEVQGVLLKNRFSSQDAMDTLRAKSTHEEQEAA